MRTVPYFKGNYIELAKIPQQEMIKPFKVLGRKVDFFKLGMAYVPLPKDKKKSRR